MATGRGTSPAMSRSLSEQTGGTQSNSGARSRSASSKEARPSSEQPQPLTYRGIRSLKHKHDKAYQDGLKKSSSLHNIGDSADSEDIQSGSAAASVTTHRDRAKRSQSLERPVSVRAHTSVGRSNNNPASTSVVMLNPTQQRVLPHNANHDSLDTTDKPKTLFESLIAPPVPAKPVTRASRYRRLAGIPDSRSIEDYHPEDNLSGDEEVPTRRTRHKSLTDIELEKMDRANIVAHKAKLWEARSAAHIESQSQFTTRLGRRDRNAHLGAHRRSQSEGPPTRRNNFLNDSSSHVDRSHDNLHGSQVSASVARPPVHAAIRHDAASVDTSHSSTVASKPPAHPFRSRTLTHTPPSSQQRASVSPPAWSSAEGRGREAFRSRSPTSSLLLNGSNKNETDEHKVRSWPTLTPYRVF